MRYYIDEYFDNRGGLIHDYHEIKDVILQKHNDGYTVQQIVDFLPTWLYIFQDDEEKQWYENIVNSIIERKPIKNRFVDEVYV